MKIANSISKLPLLLVCFLLQTEIAEAKDGRAFTKEEADIINGPICEAETEQCTEPAGWVGLSCEGLSSEEAFFLLVDGEEVNASPTAIVVSIEEYDLKLFKRTLRKKTEKLYWGGIYQNSRKSYSLNRQNLTMYHPQYSGKFQCEIKSINETVKPLINKIKRAKTSNKI